MEQVPVRSLRNETARLLQRVKDGEVLEVTQYGHPVARLVPITLDRWAQLKALGSIEPRSEDGNLLDDEPPPPGAGLQPLSEILMRQRAER